MRVFKFDELTTEAKEHALDTLGNINVDESYHAIDQFNTILESIGFYNTKILFSGFWSQGDGACFTCDSFTYKRGSIKDIKKEYPQWHELHAELDNFMEVLKRYFYSVDIKISHSGMYYHENSVSLEVAKDDGAWHVNWISHEGHELFTDALRGIMQLIYKSLEEEYNYLTSEAAIIETIECDEYEFTIDGDMI